MNSTGENYTSRGWQAAAVLIVVLLAVAFIPPQTIGNVKLRRANILSDLWVFDDAPEVELLVDALESEELPRFDLDSVAVAAATAMHVPAAQIVYEWRVGGSTAANTAPLPDSVRKSPRLIPVEDFSDGRLAAFYDTLLQAQRPVRIAFLGDSFVEGDILTADLRERLQQNYGGGGTGFAPMASPLTAFRRSVKTQSRGWTSYNIMQRKSAPEALRNQFFVSGWVSLAGPGASTTWSTTDFRDRLEACSEARIFFVSPSDSRIELILNDTLRNTFAVDGASSLREIVVTAPQIRTLTFRVGEGASGLLGYGAQFGAGKGVSVDNYSVRSNNSRALLWTSPSVDAQLHALMPYDLVILQYGLNIMQQGVYKYDRYGEQLDQVIAFVRQCFPGAAVLLLGVSDRSVKTDGAFETMDALPWLTACQRAAAERNAAAFWPTAEAMQSWGGMAHFVTRGWAGKDYTHINYEGGRRIAWSLADAIDAGVEACLAQQLEELRRRNRRENVLDSLQYHRLLEELLPAVKPLRYGLERN